MATLTARMVAEIMRQRLGLADASQSARIINGIPDALKATGRVVAASPSLRPLFTTPKATTTAVLSVTGTIDLTALYTANHILKEFFDKGQIYTSSTAGSLAIAPIPKKAQSFTQQFSDFTFYYIEGDTLYVRSSSATAPKPTGTIYFAVPYYPTALTELSDSDELQSIFLDKLFEWCLDAQMPGNDAAEDGTN